MREPRFLRKGTVTNTPGAAKQNNTTRGAGGDKGEEKAREETEHKTKSYRETGGYGMAVQKANS